MDLSQVNGTEREVGNCVGKIPIFSLFMLIAVDEKPGYREETTH